MTTTTSQLVWDDFAAGVNRAIMSEVDSMTDDQCPQFIDRCVNCGSQDSFQLCEVGYERYTDANLDFNDDETAVEAVHGWTDGWDDMTETGTGPTFIVCRSCGAMHNVGADTPDIEWD